MNLQVLQLELLLALENKKLFNKTTYLNRVRDMLDNENDSIFEKVESKTNVKKDDIVKLAKSITGKDLNDEKNIRKLIKDVARLAGKDVSKDKEEKIINEIKKDKIPKDLKNVM